MQKGDTARTMTGKTGVVVGFPIYGRPTENGTRRVQLELVCQFDASGPPVLIRAAYDPRDVEAVDAERKPTKQERLERSMARLAAAVERRKMGRAA